MAHSSGLDRAVAFICDRQEADGCWRDWRLPPGESRMWTTAYVGYRLAALRGTRHDDAIAPALTRAAAWLQSASLPDGGWGYSEVAGPDADSTALAIIFLRRVGEELPADAVATLLRHQQDDGGFATFEPEWSRGAWIVSHPEVTATALVALACVGYGCADSVDRGLRYLWRHRGADALWPSYWWTSPLYAAEAVSACATALDHPLPAAELLDTLTARPDGSTFDAALRLLTLKRIGATNSEAAAECVMTLESTQSADGGWPAAAELRLTDRQIYEPWRVENDNSGPLFRDERRLFTTATAIAALGP